MFADLPYFFRIDQFWTVYGFGDRTLALVLPRLFNTCFFSFISFLDHYRGPYQGNARRLGQYPGIADAGGE